ncbi:hypothetical protein ACOSQ2_000607 [Xanthoceras sorbifolium]
MDSAASATASKKRKLCHDDHREKEEDNEEEKMEEFFALVRSIREARDRLMINGSYENKKQTQNNTSTTMKRKLEEDHQKPVIEAWKPTFQREDFLQEEPDQLKNPHVSLLSSSQNKEGTDQKADQDIKEGLDLTLSL